jgi:nanoRNase/pAp phosphatase (c-di-AMP/oligoRNAs hydrolase)
MTEEVLKKFTKEISVLETTLGEGKHVLITAPGTADGDSVASQLALKQMIVQKYPDLKVTIVNDEPVPERYLFLPGIEGVLTPESCPLGGPGGN